MQCFSAPRALAVLVFISLLAGVPKPAAAHMEGQSYVYLNVAENSLTGRFEVEVDDLHRVVNLDLDGDGETTNDEIRAGTSTAVEYLRTRLTLRHEGKDIPPTMGGLLDVIPTEAGRFARFEFTIPELSPPPESVDVRFDLLYNDGLPSHLCMVLIENNVRRGIQDNESRPAALYRPGEEWQTVQFDPEPFATVLYRFIGEGVWHIWIGLDHILFIIALLLPSVLVLREGSYQPAESFQESFWYVARVATLFTVAHSVTLSLSSLNIFRLPSAPVEAMIALSIAVTAWGNIRPYLEGRGVWVMIFGFGLFHGFGFASVLAPLGLDASSLLAGLLGFNIGVELGQLAIIAAVFPVLFVLRRTPIYIPIVLRLGSALLIAMALFWFVERMGEVVYLLQDKGYL